MLRRVCLQLTHSPPHANEHKNIKCISNRNNTECQITLKYALKYFKSLYHPIDRIFSSIHLSCSQIIRFHLFTWIWIIWSHSSKIEFKTWIFSVWDTLHCCERKNNDHIRMNIFLRDLPKNGYDEKCMKYKWNMI